MRNKGNDGHRKNPFLAKIVPDNDGHKPLRNIRIQPNIGLESEVRDPVVDILNISLANESVLSQKTRGAHWNVSGAGFFEMHILFDTQYKQLNEMANQIAERVRILGGIAIASFEEILSHSKLKEKISDVPDVLHLLADHESIIRFMREDVRKCTEEYEDEGTFDLLVSLMRLHEKMAWMLRSYIENEPVLVIPGTA